MPIIPHHCIAQVNQTKKLKRREVKVGINALILEQEFHTYLCMGDDDPYQSLVRLLVEDVKVEQGLEQLNDGSVVLNAAKNMM